MLYDRRNIAGPQKELWFHRDGCETWVSVTRDTRRDIEITESRREIYTLKVSLTDRGSEPVILKPDLEYFPKMNLLYARPAIDASLIRDVQVIISEWERSTGEGAVLRINIQPLISWIWTGGAVMTLGGIILFFTGKKFYQVGIN